MPTAEYQRQAFVRQLSALPVPLQGLIALHYCRIRQCDAAQLLAEAARVAGGRP